MNTPGKAAGGRSRKQRSAARLGRADWVGKARAALIEGGVAAVKIDVIAGQLGVTTGSFYWHFRDRQDLLAELLADWEHNSSEPLFRAVAKAGDDAALQFRRLCLVWLEEREFSPEYDSAMRDWARISPEVEEVVRRVDDRRVELLRSIFVQLGNGRTEALVRARITYFHQVGYYALRMAETKERRLELFPTYVKLLLGREPT